MSVLSSVAAGGLVLSQLLFADPYQEARAREVAALEAERSQLQEELGAAQRAGAAARQKLRGEAESLARRLGELEAESASLELDITGSEQLRATQTEAEHFAELGAEVGAWITAQGLEAPQAEGAKEGAEAFPLQLERVLARVESESEIRVASREVFDASGRPTQRELLSIGSLAHVDADGGSGAYARSADGWHQVPGFEAEIRTLEDGSRLVHTWVQDPERPFDVALADHGWRDTVRRGGPLMWVLLAFAAVGALVLVERLIVLGWAWLRRRRLETLLDAQPDADAAALARAGGSVAAPILAASGDGSSSSLEAREQKAVAAMRSLHDALNRRLSVMAMLSGAAPLVGLLGTVSGMISTFSVVTEKGSSDPQAMAGGISEALLTTQYGLIVAIPLLLAHVLLSRGAGRLSAWVEGAALRRLFDQEREGEAS